LIKTLQVGSRPVTLRVSSENDREFLYRIYAESRSEELAPVSWTPEQKDQFLRQQFQAQDESYHSNYPGAEFLIIVVDSIDAGRLFLHRREKEIRIMDIALLPPFCNQGIGTALLRMVMDEAARSERIATIHVEFFNRARKLYERLGFRQIGQTEVYLLMEWSG
jgi:RimJ/RimL family protein N-acetyltransferase